MTAATGRDAVPGAEVPALSVTGVTKRFGGVTAVSGISMAVYPGELFGIIGPNGAGKTTLLDCLSGIVRTGEGAISLNGKRIEGLRPYQICRLGMGRTFQSADHLAELSVLDFVLLGRSGSADTSLFRTALGTRGVRASEARHRDEALALLSIFDMQGTWNTHVGELPYGSRKALDVLRALALDPAVLLLDEPTSGTTSSDRDVLRRVLQEVKSRHISCVAVDHDVTFIADVCDRAMAMNLGAEMCTGTPGEVLANPEVMRAYLGTQPDS
jgi:branched-chain amino acid transport system ATP-binding protein